MTYSPGSAVTPRTLAGYPLPSNTGASTHDQSLRNPVPQTTVRIPAASRSTTPPPSPGGLQTGEYRSSVGASIAECLRHYSRDGVVLPSLRRNEADRATMLGSAAVLHVKGVEVDWRGVYPHAERVATLPGYAWQRERFWFGRTVEAVDQASPILDHPLLGFRHVGPRAAELALENTS